jgi:hypothetical protein
MTENFLKLNFIFFMFKNHGNVAWTYKLVKKKKPKQGGRIIWDRFLNLFLKKIHPP